MVKWIRYWFCQKCRHKFYTGKKQVWYRWLWRRCPKCGQFTVKSKGPVKENARKGRCIKEACDE